MRRKGFELARSNGYPPADFIQQNLRLGPIPAIPEIMLYLAHSGSGLSRLDPDGEAPAPYWAFAWGGGLALARHVLDHREIVAGQRVLDLGAGSGLAGIAAMKAGAATVMAAEIDRYGQAALSLNAAANSVFLSPVSLEITAAETPAVDLILAGDVFYAPDVAGPMLAFLIRCQQAGIAVLIGDPGRRDLPSEMLRLVASYPVGDVGATDTLSSVFVLHEPRLSGASAPLPG